jgi:hypothetical protein
MNKYLGGQTRNTLWNYLRPWAYFKHPELKVNPSSQKWKNLLTMRDLRYWILENAPHSSRAFKHNVEIEHINKEINYLQFKGNKFFLSISLACSFAYIQCFYYLVQFLQSSIL